jgi:hypothetical protein
VIHGPRVSSSPTALPSDGTTSPVSPVSRPSTPQTSRPWDARYGQTSSPVTPAGSRATEPMGESSVIPQAWVMVSPYSSE